MAEFNDFGFTAVDDTELEPVVTTSTQLSEAYSALRQIRMRIDRLLTNLQANPEKDYLYWPNRVEHVEAFRRELDAIAIESDDEPNFAD